MCYVLIETVPPTAFSFTVALILPIDDCTRVEYKPGMRAMLILLLGGVLLAGCRHPDAKEARTGAENKTSNQKRREKTTSKPASARESTPQATPLHESAGKIASVNSSLRFVVIDFAMNSLPPVDQRMSVYRQGQKVGEVKISGQSRNNIIAADLTAGDAQVGDEVRNE